MGNKKDNSGGKTRGIGSTDNHFGELDEGERRLYSRVRGLKEEDGTADY
jgi:hypothetical protein